MLTQGYGKIIGNEYCDFAKLYTTSTKSQLIAAMDVWSTQSIWSILQSRGKFPHLGPILVTTACSLERTGGVGSLYSLCLPVLDSNRTKTIEYQNHSQRECFSVTHYGDYATTTFEYRLLHELPQFTSPANYLPTGRQLGADHIITRNDLNHYDSGILHGSWIINQLLSQIDNNPTNMLHPGRQRHIKFHYPGKLDDLVAVYHNPQGGGYDLVCQNPNQKHLIARILPKK